MLEEELIIEDWLTPEGLQTYRRNVENFERLAAKKEKIVRNMSGLQSVDFAKDKVTNGNSRHMSPQEILAIRLEDINKQLDAFCILFNTLKPALVKQIGKLQDFDSRRVLQLFYLDNVSSNSCTMYFYGDESDIKENWENYIQKFKTLKRQALKDFSKLATVKHVVVEQKQIF